MEFTPDRMLAHYRLVEKNPACPDPADLGPPAPGAGAGAIRPGPSGDVQVEIPDGGLSLEAVERAMLTGALAKAGGNQSGAARLLGISRDTLRYRLEKYGLSGE